MKIEAAQRWDDMHMMEEGTVMMRLKYFVVGLLLAFAIPAPGECAEEIRILMIGNSHTHGIKSPLKRLFASVGVSAEIKTRARNAWTLDRHLNSSHTLSALDQHAWDYIILQEPSAGMFGARYDVARALDALVRSAGAQPLFYMTFVNGRGEPARFSLLRGDPSCTSLCTGYAPLAHQLGTSVVPIGQAVEDLGDLVPEERLFTSGLRHLNGHGRYLAALTIFAAIYGNLPQDLWTPRFLTPDLESGYRQAVEGTVIGEADLWQLPAGALGN